MSSASLTPYLYFGGDCRTAMNFYQGVFGGELSVTTFSDLDSSAPGSLKDKVMHATLVTDQFLLMASDDPEGKTNGLGNVRMILHGTDQALLAGWFNRLAADGSVIQALEKQLWGDTYGELTDRFGMRWMFNLAAGS